VSLLHEAHPDVDAPSVGGTEDGARQQAIKQIERRRHFHIEAGVSAVLLVLLVATWATSEYRNAGGWPTHGFSQSSSIPHVWNYWIVYPVVVISLILAGRAWSVYGHIPISEREIQREIEREAGRS